MVEIRARSRSPARVSRGIDSRSFLASSRLQTGVLPRLTTYFGPRRSLLVLSGSESRVAENDSSYYQVEAAGPVTLVSKLRSRISRGRTRFRLRPLRNPAGSPRRGCLKFA